MPTIRITPFDGAAVSSYSAEGDGVIKNRQPDCDDAAVDHLVHGFR